MKLKELTQRLLILNQVDQPILLLDNDDTSYMLKYRHTKEIPIGFYGYFNYELVRYMDDILELDVVFSCDKGNTFNLYVNGLKDLFKKINKGE